MSKKAVALAGLALAATVNGALAADIPGGPYRPYAPAQMQPLAYSWVGPYVGVNGGYQWGSVANSTAEPSGSAFGLQLGYNWQTNQVVYGLETDIQWSNADDRVGSRKFSDLWFGTTRGRVGYAMNNFLVYATGGLAYGELELVSGGKSGTQTSIGWTLGMGAEVGLTPNWTAKVEYLYFDLANQNFSNGGSHGLESSLLRAGVNYKF